MLKIKKNEWNGCWRQNSHNQIKTVQITKKEISLKTNQLISLRYFKLFFSDQYPITKAWYAQWFSIIHIYSFMKLNSCSGWVDPRRDPLTCRLPDTTSLISSFSAVLKQSRHNILCTRLLPFLDISCSAYFQIKLSLLNLCRASDVQSFVLPIGGQQHWIKHRLFIRNNASV